MTAPVLKNNQWISSPWAEYIGRGGATSDGAFGWEGGNQQSMTILVDWSDWETGRPLLDILGRNFFNTFTGNLDRPLPARHPVFDHLYASRITGARPVRWKSKAKNTKFSYGFHSTYDFCLLTILFTQPRWVMLEDSSLDVKFGQPRIEYHRFIEWRPESGAEYLQRPEGSFFWVEGPANTKPFPGVTSVFTAKMEFTAVWRRVPAIGLFSDGGKGPPTNLEAAVGTVNSGPWLGFPTGTMLLKPPRFEPLEVPTPESVALGILDTQVPLAYNVYLPFTYFNPNGVDRGHTRAPYPGDNTFYRINSKADGTGSSVYPQSDPLNIFKLQA